MVIPPGFGTVVPFLFIKDAGEYIRFLLTAFECEEVGRSVRPDGQIEHAQVRVGTTTLMISEADDRYQPSKSSFYIFVDDVEIAMKRAIESGAKLEMEVMDMPYGDRQGGIQDPVGNIWWISQRLSAEPYF